MFVMLVGHLSNLKVIVYSVTTKNTWRNVMAIRKIQFLILKQMVSYSDRHIIFFFKKQKIIINFKYYINLYIKKKNFL